MTEPSIVVHGTERVSPELTAKVEGIIERIVELYEARDDHRPWIVAFSGGKDSTLVGHLVFEAVARVRPSRHTRPVHLLSSDTLV